MEQHGPKQSSGDHQEQGAGILEKLRQAEMDAVRRWFKPGMRVLEIGGGSGWQASIIASSGCEVLSIDIAGRLDTGRSFYPVQDYDGQNIPAADATFDIVFSSNVLEHVRGLTPLLEEIKRVLKPDGLAIHILPTSVWRFWTSVGYIGEHVRTTMRRPSGTPETPQPRPRLRAWAGRVKRDVVGALSPHGEYSGAPAELYYFSKRRWLGVFRENGFDVIENYGNRLLYTGHALFPNLPLRIRRRMSSMLGSSCHIFVMRPRT